MNTIRVKNASIHNLKHIEVEIPKSKLVLLTGISGSGKTSFAFDTLYEEGRKRYLKLLGILRGEESTEDTNLEIHGLSPTIAIKQKVIRSQNPRSVVGTKTKISDYLRRLYAEESRNTISGGEKEHLDSTYFSFNTPVGMCMECKGRGSIISIDLEQLLEEKELTVGELMKKVCMPERTIKKELVPLLESWGNQLEDRYAELEASKKSKILYGVHSKEEVLRFWGIVPYVMQQAEKNKEETGFTKKILCPECKGYRVSELTRQQTINGKHIGELSSMSIKELKDFLEHYANNTDLSIYSRGLVSIVVRKLEQLMNVELSYLTLYREIPTLSGGELQRLYFMSIMDLKLESVTVIFDEPTSGLHEIEKEKLIDNLHKICYYDNNVIVVEHDRRTIQRADYIIDFGPYAGKNGGEIVYQGDYSGLLHSGTITGNCLSGAITFPDKKKEDSISLTQTEERLKLVGCNVNNLKNVTVTIPLHRIVGIAGVSGSGKSSLIFQALVPLLQKELSHSDLEEIAEAEVSSEQEKGKLENGNTIHSLRLISQDVIGKNNRSIVATYLGIFDEIRNLFSRLEESKRRKWKKDFFSFNSKGACQECKGLGEIESVYEYLGSFKRKCPCCNGKRYQDEVLTVTYRGKNISEVLSMSVEEACEFFQDQKAIYPFLKTLKRVDMGYVTLDQVTTTLSGGETQRLKLAKELGKKDKAHTLYLMDEPTTGLSFYDTAKLMALINELKENGNSVIVIEHDCDVLAYCDYLIELGPGAGNEGGTIIAEGTPSQLKQNKKSIIKSFLPEEKD